MFDLLKSTELVITSTDPDHQVMTSPILQLVVDRVCDWPLAKSRSHSLVLVLKSPQHVKASNTLDNVEILDLKMHCPVASFPKIGILRLAWLLIHNVISRLLKQ